MDIEKIAKFLKKLRKDNLMTQEKLAILMNTDRTKINKLENGKRLPNVDDLIFYSKIFDISMEEIIACEKKNKNNTKKIQNKFLEYLKIQDSRNKKIKFIFIILSILLAVCFIFITSLYFFQNFNTIKIYKFYGESQNYQILDGLLILSKEQIYFNIGKIVPEVENVKIISEIDGNKEVIYDGDYENILNDKYGYNSFISYKNFLAEKQKIYILINDEVLPITFVEQFTNNKFYYNKNKTIGDLERKNEIADIPLKIQENFNCDEYSCTLNEKDKTLFYNLGIFTLIFNDFIITYDTKTDAFIYSNQGENISFSILNGEVICEKGNCENASKIYKDFEKNYIEKYIKN